MSVSDILDGKLTEKEVEIKGWLVTKRSGGGVQFLMVRDGTGTIQATVHKDEVSKKVFSDTDKLTQESSIKIKGLVKEDKRAPGGYEIRIKDLQIIHLAEQEYPLGKKEHGIDFLLSFRQLWVRSPRQVAILKVRAEIVKACRDFLDERGFTLTDSPILTPAAVEGVATLFEVPYFGDKAFLTQSGQLYVEATIAAFGKVYCFGPTFRAEKSKTPRHLTEFWMLEPEMAFYTFEDNLKLQEELVTYIVKTVLERRKRELEALKRDLKPLKKVEPPFERISYTEAIEMLQKAKCPIQWGEDLGAPHERFISLKFEKPVFVHRYPAKVKAFYMQPDPKNPEVALCADLMAPEGYGEIIGGSERIHDLKLLEQRIEEFGLPKKAYEWYLDLRRYGSVPHSGFGLGLERTVMWICKLKHIRETIPFPRTITRIYP
ncbi:MAG: asparagine--tRNA ligase [Candidatus Bathyarchaeota archaeon]|jgi:asparaginyl-tRNA synthetase|nr:asparagine--tRNA ligase [Candidatus Bathyarchaeota archaeon A05DMB-5]MDH7557565.1 asparagine--tRNA ligase [Candidatus Bathyarchaeota archaeon]